MNDTLKKIAEMKKKAQDMNAKMDSMIRTQKLRDIMRAEKATPAVKADIVDVLRSIANDM